MYAPTFVIAAVLAIAQLAIATPPACLIAALGQQSNPADIKGLCGSLQSAMDGNLTKVCAGDSLTSAYDVYSSTCLGVGVTVSALPTASGSGSGSGNGSGGAGATPTGSSTGSAASPSESNKNAASADSPGYLHMLAILLAMWVTVAVSL